jgi:hypothetical protein
LHRRDALQVLAYPDVLSNCRISCVGDHLRALEAPEGRKGPANEEIPVDFSCGHCRHGGDRRPPIFLDGRADPATDRRQLELPVVLTDYASFERLNRPGISETPSCGCAIGKYLYLQLQGHIKG